MHPTLVRIAVPAAALFGLTACSHMGAPSGMPMVDNANLPQAVRVPAGHRQVMATVGKGEITYECRARNDMAGAHAWAFVAPVADLVDASGKSVGRYYGGPTWEARDGSKVTGKQVGVAPSAAGSIPMQLVKAEPAMGAGAMQGVAYIQRINTQAGVAPAAACGAGNVGEQQKVGYQADYIFYAGG